MNGSFEMLLDYILGVYIFIRLLNVPFDDDDDDFFFLNR